ncbi:MAG TPA: hypothetical protein VE968_02395, partial [Sphingomicrobium sp.]|nr:hypothetical protein [Sphingomicrobium sp.]
MPAYAQRQKIVRPRERAYALTAVVLVQFGLALVLLSGFHVDLAHPGSAVQKLINVALSKPPPPPVPPRLEKVPVKRRHRATSAPKAAPVPVGGSPGPKVHHAPPSVTPIV